MDGHEAIAIKGGVLLKTSINGYSFAFLLIKLVLMNFSLVF